MCNKTVNTDPVGKKRGELFDNGGWDYIDPPPKPKTGEELLALKKRKDEKDYMGFISDLIR